MSLFASQFPQVIDIEAFTHDCYNSLAKGLVKFRDENKITADTIIRVLGISSYRYKQIEKLDSPVSIPAEAGVKLQSGLGLDNTLIFTEHMDQFPMFHQARYAQGVRL